MGRAHAARCSRESYAGQGTAVTINAASTVPSPSRHLHRGYWIGLASAVSIGAVIAGTEGARAVVAILITLSVPTICALTLFLGWRTVSKHPRIRAALYKDLTV
jgi:hypothetical protein